MLPPVPEHAEGRNESLTPRSETVLECSKPSDFKSYGKEIWNVILSSKLSTGVPLCTAMLLTYELLI